MKLKPVNKLHTATTGELLAMCKLVQMVANHEQFYKITPEVWNEYLCTSLGLEREGADAIINRSRRLASRMLAEYDAE
jgi:hypothetical protein